MKKTQFIILFLLAFIIKSNAQCTGCTTNITGLDASNHIISSGQVFCIAPTGTVTGLITVSAGGTLCNQGKINSTNVWIAGGSFKNYGTIDSYNLLVSSAGTFTNYTTALIDSLMITQTNSKFINIGSQTGIAFTVADHASLINTGSINEYDMYDSIATVDNSGNLTITNDFGNAYSSNFTNNNYMKVQRDFYNATNANFTTNCMITVGRDWYNSANVYGSTINCGGFNIAGNSLSSGLIGSASTHIDLCDAGHPALGIDGPGGTIINTTSFCNCSNNCVLVTGINNLTVPSSSIKNIYPNPSSNKITININSLKLELLSIEITDLLGKTILTTTITANIGENEVELNITNLSQGTYILSISDPQLNQTKQLFNVSQ